MVNIPKPPVEESAAYDNYLDRSSKEDDKYRSNLDMFFDEEIEIPLVHMHKRKNDTEKLERLIYVHFRNIEDHLDFCNKVGQIITFDTKYIYFPIENGILSDEDNKITNVDINLIRPKKKIITDTSSKLDVEDNPNYTGSKEWMKHWKGMPEFSQSKNEPYKSVYVKIRTKDDLESIS